MVLQLFSGYTPRDAQGCAIDELIAGIGSGANEASGIRLLPLRPPPGTPHWYLEPSPCLAPQHIVSSTCTYSFGNFGANGTAIGTPSPGTVVAGTSFVINSLATTNTTATGDTSKICWTITP